MKLLMVATDGSEGASAALKAAADTADIEAARLLVLTVSPRSVSYHRPSGMAKEITEYARSEHLAGGSAEAGGMLAEDILTEARKIVGRRSLDTNFISCAGDPAEEIVACARERVADALYLGSRGLSRVGSFLLGSVSRRVSASAPCPVVIVQTSAISGALGNSLSDNC
jgi:nucleotide-binding universal stress UspA family protein